MKKSIILLVLALPVLPAKAQSPNFQEFFSQKKTQIKYLVQQIAALKVHLEYLKEGYDIVNKGLNTVGEIRDGKFSIDKTYLGSLKAISPVVRDSPKLKACLGIQANILKELQALNSDCQADESFSGEERDYVGAVYANVLNQCQHFMSELEIVATAGQAEMQDEERLSRLDRVHENFQELYAFSQEFASSTRLLSVQRRKELQEINATRRLYQEI